MITPILKDTKVVFGPCRLSYTHLFTKYAPEGSTDEGKYMTNILVPKTEKETLKALKQAIERAKTAAIASKWNGKEPKKIDMPLRDGDEKENDPDGAYENHYYLNAKCNTRPGIVDKNKELITDEEEVYSGMWAVVSVTFYAYDVSGSKGVACGLNNVMKYKDDARLGGRVSAEADFADVDLSDGTGNDDDDDWDV